MLSILLTYSLPYMRNVHHDELTIIMRRYMMKIAEHFADEDKCLGLITGESIGQVASQTMQSACCNKRGCAICLIQTAHCHGPE